MKNVMELKFKAIAENEPFARSAITSFILPLNPSLDEISDIKTAVNEAISNVVVHAYPDKDGFVNIKVTTDDNQIEINVSDNGVGIADIDRARTPFFTSKPNEERSGMGFTVMESFMDKLEVKNGKTGLIVCMTKEIQKDVSGM